MEREDDFREGCGIDWHCRKFGDDELQLHGQIVPYGRARAPREPQGCGIGSAMTRHCGRRGAPTLPDVNGVLQLALM